MIIQVIKLIIIQILIDIFYLKLISSKFSKMISNIQGYPIKFKLYSAIITYILMSYGLKILVIDTKNSLNEKFKKAFLLGVVVYGVFDFTNLTIIDKWQLEISIMDMIWGGILFVLTVYFDNKIKLF